MVKAIYSICILLALWPIHGNAVSDCHLKSRKISNPPNGCTIENASVVEFAGTNSSDITIQNATEVIFESGSTSNIVITGKVNSVVGAPCDIKLASTSKVHTITYNRSCGFGDQSFNPTQREKVKRAAAIHRPLKKAAKQPTNTSTVTGPEKIDEMYSYKDEKDSLHFTYSPTEIPKQFLSSARMVDEETGAWVELPNKIRSNIKNAQDAVEIK